MNSPLEKPDRNRQIYIDKVVNNLTFRELEDKYGVSVNRLQFIVKRERQLESPPPQSQPAGLTLDQIKSKAAPILRNVGASRAAVFGSYARGDNRPDSDVDILVELPKGLSLLDVVGIKLDLEDTLNKSVDLVEYHTIKPRIRENILHSQILIL